MNAWHSGLNCWDKPAHAVVRSNIKNKLYHIAEKPHTTTKAGNHYWEHLMMDMKAYWKNANEIYEKCKERKMILHLEAIIRSLIVGITPVDLWTSVAEMQGHDSFTAINSLLTDEKQSNLYLLLCKSSVRWKAIRHPLLWGGSAAPSEMPSACSFMDLTQKNASVWLLVDISLNGFLFGTLKHLEYNHFTTDFINYNLFPKFSVKRHLRRFVVLHVSNM